MPGLLEELPTDGLTRVLPLLHASARQFQGEPLDRLAPLAREHPPAPPRHPAPPSPPPPPPPPRRPRGAPRARRAPLAHEHHVAPLRHRHHRRETRALQDPVLDLRPVRQPRFAHPEREPRTLAE